MDLLRNLLLIGLGALVALFVAGVVLQRRMGKMATIATTTPLAIEPLDVALPDRLAALRTELEDIGLPAAGERIATVAGYDTRVAQIHHLGDDGALLVEAVCGFKDREPDPLMAVQSVLEGRRGLLTTETHRMHPAPMAELVQVFEGASAAELVDAHRTALALLADRGVRADALSAADVTDATAWIHLFAGSPFADDPAAARAALQEHLQESSHEGPGPLADHDDLDERIAAIADAGD